MPRFDTVQVCVDVDGSGQTASMGELHCQRSGASEIFSFEYDKHWLARSRSNTMAAAERSKPI
jgi:hypothetical protein